MSEQAASAPRMFAFIPGQNVDSGCFSALYSLLAVSDVFNGRSLVSRDFAVLPIDDQQVSLLSSEPFRV